MASATMQSFLGSRPVTGFSSCSRVRLNRCVPASCVPHLSKRGNFRVKNMAEVSPIFLPSKIPIKESSLFVILDIEYYC